MLTSAMWPKVRSRRVKTTCYLLGLHEELVGHGLEKDCKSSGVRIYGIVNIEDRNNDIYRTPRGGPI